MNNRPARKFKAKVLNGKLVLPSTKLFRENLRNFEGKEVVVTEKMDGENTSAYNDYIHARSLDSRNHVSRNWVKNFHAQIGYNIPEDWRVCGENMWAEHSIKYDNLETYFYGFSVGNERNECLSWDETLEWFELLGITPVKVLYRGIYNEATLKDIADNLDTEHCEGYVLRLAESFPYSGFRHCVGKCVRQGHVQTAKHWFFGAEIKQNGLKA